MSLIIVLAVGLGLLCWISRRPPVTAQWIEELSVDRYHPMMRLLEPEDLDFLRGQPGFTWRIPNRLREQRCQHFRSYLRTLDQDFQQVSMALRLIRLHSSHDHTDLAAALIRREFGFALRMIAVRLRLFLFRSNLCRVDAAGVIQMFDSMRLQFKGLIAATADLIA
jgi:hypothetical protein